MLPGVVCALMCTDRNTVKTAFPCDTSLPFSEAFLEPIRRWGIEAKIRHFEAGFLVF